MVGGGVFYVDALIDYGKRLLRYSRKLFQSAADGPSWIKDPDDSRSYPFSSAAFTERFRQRNVADGVTLQHRINALAGSMVGRRRNGRL